MRRTNGPVAVVCTAALVLLVAAGCRQSTPDASTREGRSKGGDAPEPTRPRRRDPVRAALSSLGLDEKIGQLMWPYVYGANARTDRPADRRANRALYGVDHGAQLISDYHVGGLIYLDHNTLDPDRSRQSTHNLDHPAQTAKLTRELQRAARRDSGIGLLIATDQEGGPVVRLTPPAISWPPAEALGRIGDTRLAFAAARAAGAELRATGITVNFAPVADVNVEPDNPVIGERSFGADPRRVARMVRAQVRGYAAAGVAPTAKHWPGHGDTTVDSHVGLPIIEHSRAVWESLDKPPFAAAIAARVPLVMSGHISLPAVDASGLPATLSPKLTTGLLRKELGFEGVIVTDSLWMAGVRAGRSDPEIAVRAIEAGADVLLMPPDLRGAFRAVRAAVRSGRLSRSRIDASALRVLRVKHELGVLKPPDIDLDAVERVVGNRTHRALLQKIFDAAT